MAFPDVPIAPGVPPLPRDPTAVADIIDVLAGDQLFGVQFNQWGIYLDGAPIIIPDTITSFDFKREWAIANYPIEDGGFMTYDKVDTPFASRVQLASGGSAENRQALLDQVDLIAQSIDLYEVVTPEKVYLSANVLRYDYKRTPGNGLGIIIIDLWLLEVRITAVAGAGNAQSPGGQNQVNGGTVQPSANWPPSTSSVQYLQAFPFNGTPLPSTRDVLAVQ